MNDVGTAPDQLSKREVAVAVRARLEGLRTGGPYTITPVVSYQAVDETLVPLLHPESFEITEGVPVETSFTVSLDTCLEDADRAEAASGGCVLWLTLTLADRTGELAAETVTLGLVRERDQVVYPGTITLIPSFTLTIQGGGNGTGSGTITVPAAADQPELECEITDGVAAPTGCSSRYPPHTSLALTAVDGDLAAWGADCDGVAPADPCELALDDHRTAIASFDPPDTTGDLRVQIDGLPSGVAAQVTVTNDRGFSQDLTESTTLTGLSPGGDYQVTAASVFVAAEDRTYSSEPPTQAAVVVAGDTALVLVGYNPPQTGGLAVVILGLPEDVGALVTVTGPDFPEGRDLTEGQTLTGLNPGEYTVEAGTVETADQVYAPDAASQASTVSADATVYDTVRYSATRGTLTVTVSGLPDGSPAAITVTGPSFSRELTGTVSIVKLALGAYQIAAANVRAEGRTFAPGQPTQTAQLSAGAESVVSVGYSALPAVRLEKLPPDDVTCIVNTFCEGLFGVRALDAAGFSVASARIRWTAGNPTSGCPEGSHTDVRTDIDGVARASNQCRYPTPGTYSQTAAIVINGEVVSSTTVTFTFRLVTGPPSAETSTIAVSTDTLRTCCDTATVTVTARDAGGNPLAGRSVVLESDGESLAIQAQPDSATNSNGVATGRIVGRVIGSAGVRARIDGVLIEDIVTVAVTAGIAFAQVNDIVVMRQSGAGPVNLTAGVPGLAQSPAWSPDGSRLAFSVSDCDESGCFQDIYVMNVDGSGLLNLTDRLEEDAFAPAWSPDEATIAFHSDPCHGDGQCQRIWVVQSTGSTPKPITPLGTSASSPDWSPDGSKILFVNVNCIEGCVTTLQTMDSDGGSNAPLSTTFVNQFPQDPRWSPDGTRIAVTLGTCNDGCEFDIAVVNSSGSDLVNLTLDLENDASRPAWSPGGGRIAFALDRCNDGCDQIALMSSRDGSAVTPLQDGSEPHWR